ncbi:MAG: cupin domain-containing protein [Acidobacteria bacterium]|nr:cupin domain-containing protein [Acidobacteriota bacterium]
MRKMRLVSPLLFALGLGQVANGQTPNEPAHIPASATTRILWGDQTSGRVHDSRFGGSQKIMWQIFGMGPGELFRHSDRFTTEFTVDGIYYVLSGAMVLSNPATGEVYRVNPGELAFLTRNSWNHGFTYGLEPLRVLEYLPRLSVTAGEKNPPYLGQGKLTQVKYAKDEWLEKWPAALDEARRSATHRVVREADILWRMEGEKHQVLVGIMASTDQITFGKILLHPKEETEVRIHGGDAGLYLQDGEVHVRLAQQTLDARGQTRWFDVKAGDGVYLPEGTPHQYYNPSDRMATLIFGVSPSYLPKSSSKQAK